MKVPTKVSTKVPTIIVPTKSPTTKNPTTTQTTAPTTEQPSCGLFGLKIVCPFTGCGIFGRLFGLCTER
jgi:hypothetical protein